MFYDTLNVNRVNINGFLDGVRVGLIGDLEGTNLKNDINHVLTQTNVECSIGALSDLMRILHDSSDENIKKVLDVNKGFVPSLTSLLGILTVLFDSPHQNSNFIKISKLIFMQSFKRLLEFLEVQSDEFMSQTERNYIRMLCELLECLFDDCDLDQKVA